MMNAVPSVIVCADDFGISPGVNQAIINSHLQGALTHTSLLVAGKYAQEAVTMAKKDAPNLQIGLHLNLTYGKHALSSGKLGFLRVLAYSFLFRSRMRKYLYQEIEAQILQAQEMGVQLSHIDGHHHIHMIPLIFQIVKELSAKYQIPRIRIVNEQLGHTLRQVKEKNILWSMSLVNYMLLKTCYWLNRYPTQTYFFSILYSCRISSKMLESFTLPKGYTQLEIMLHPGNGEKDEYLMTTDHEYSHLASPWRYLEYETALQLKTSKIMSSAIYE